MGPGNAYNSFERKLSLGWKISVKHTSEYVYADNVTASYNEARMTPLSSPTQTVIESELKIVPKTPVFKYYDYWGTLVNAFEIQETHRTLTIISSSVVETSSLKPLDNPATWSELEDPRIWDAFSEYFSFTPYVCEIPDFIEMSQQLRKLESPYQAAEKVCDLLREILTYNAGSTSVSGNAKDAWAQRSGVCQDFAHLSLSLFRYLGIPSRYVSGYIHPVENAEVGDSTVGESHAWVDVWLNQWYPLDPTNGATVGERYIRVAQGRDYSDVKPFAGIYSGGTLDKLKVSVEVKRLA